jgi:hypothetical protein
MNSNGMKRGVIGLLFTVAFVVVGVLGGCKSISNPADPNAQPTPISWSANGSDFCLPCGAALPLNMNGCNVTLACPTPVDLSAIKISNGNEFIACVPPARMPVDSNATSVTVSAASCSSTPVTCSGVPCSELTNSGDMTVDCGGTLPCTTNSCVITIACPTLTDLSSIISANGVDFYMHQPPCRLPLLINGCTFHIY